MITGQRRVGKEAERGRDCWGASKDFEILFPPEMTPPRPRYLRGGMAEYRNYLQSVTGLGGTPPGPFFPPCTHEFSSKKLSTTRDFF